MAISVLIPTYEDADRLERTLAPLLMDEAAAEVVVVVDGCRDGSLELLQTLAAGEPRLRPFFIENRGRPGARQFALEQARGDVVLMMDSDVVAHPGLVAGHARWHADGGERLVVGYMPAVVPARRAGTFVHELYAHHYESVCALYEANPAGVFHRLWGGNISLPRRALVAAGGCDVRVGVHYTDDLEMGIRLQEQGLEPVFDRRLRADHHFDRSVDGFLSTARHQGHDLVLIDRAYPGRGAAAIPQWRDSNAGGRLRRFARRPRGYPALARSGRRLLAGLGRLHLWHAESRLGAFLERLELQRGMQEQAREARAGSPI